MVETQKPSMVYAKDFFLRNFEKEFQGKKDFKKDPYTPVDPGEKLEWVSKFFFGLVTNEPTVPLLIAFEFLEALRVITDRKTYDLRF